MIKDKRTESVFGKVMRSFWPRGRTRARPASSASEGGSEVGGYHGAQRKGSQSPGRMAGPRPGRDAWLHRLIPALGQGHFNHAGAAPALASGHKPAHPARLALIPILKIAGQCRFDSGHPSLDFQIARYQ